MIEHPELCWEETNSKQDFWSPGDTITVSFYDPQKPLEWELSLDEIAAQVPPHYMPLEKSARAKKTPADVIRHVVETYIQPVVPTITFQFVERDGDVSIRFEPNGGSCSMVGTGCLYTPRPWTMSYAWLDVGTIIHEFSHVLGMRHMLGDANIKWNLPAVYDYFKDTMNWSRTTTYLNVIAPQPSTENFDPDSIMVYPIPSSLTLDGFHTKVHVRYSPGDIQFLQQTYSVPTIAAAPSSNLLGRWIVPLVLALGIVLLLQSIFR